MFYIQELCNWDDDRESRICMEIAGVSLQNSQWTMVGGTPSGHYFDIDNYLITKEKARELAELLARHIERFSKSHEFDKIAFIDKGAAGPVGLISISSLLSTRLEKEVLIVRPKKRRLRAAVKGNLAKGDRVLILSDVATVGWTIFEAAEKIWELDAKVPYALVVIDREQGAVVNLGRKGIELLCLFSAKTLSEKMGPKIRKEFGVGIEERFDPVLVDFGGSSSTMVG